MNYNSSSLRSNGNRKSVTFRETIDSQVIEQLCQPEQLSTHPVPNLDTDLKESVKSLNETADSNAPKTEVLMEDESNRNKLLEKEKNVDFSTSRVRSYTTVTKAVVVIYFCFSFFVLTYSTLLAKNIFFHYYDATDFIDQPEKFLNTWKTGKIQSSRYLTAKRLVDLCYIEDNQLHLTLTQTKVFGEPRCLYISTKMGPLNFLVSNKHFQHRASGNMEHSISVGSIPRTRSNKATPYAEFFSVVNSTCYEDARIPQSISWSQKTQLMKSALDCWQTI